ncbi:hypothetical protein TcBrA4_0032890 [Trypanosoma cruzi]|nr:hypothetical protein TcBrA4_0032890 [Trypanosoma cruzi]
MSLTHVGAWCLALRPRAAAVDDAALAHTPRRVVDTWSRQEYLIVLGILSVDYEARRTRRNLQRSTCWQFPGVATRANEFTGAMLVLCVLGRYPSHGYGYSAALLEEAAAVFSPRVRAKGRRLEELSVDRNASCMSRGYPAT